MGTLVAVAGPLVIPASGTAQPTATTTINAPGYWLATANGHVYGLGAAASYGGFPVTTATGDVSGIAGAPYAKDTGS